MNAALGRIYLLTADHCFTDKAEISDFEYWLLIFNYQTPCGNDTSPPFTQVLQAWTTLQLCLVLHLDVRQKTRCSTKDVLLLK